MALETKRQSTAALLLLALIPLLFFSVATLILVKSHKAEVVKVEGVHHDGYEDVPTVYQVTASPAHIFAETWSFDKIFIILGWIVAIVGPPLYFAGMNKAAKSATWIICGVFWLAGILLAFGLYSLNRGKAQFGKTISEQVYQANESDLDALFNK